MDYRLRSPLLQFLGLRTVRLAAALSIALLAGVAFGVLVLASVVDSQGQVQGCYNTTSGALRIAVSACGTGEKAISWGQGVGGIQEFRATTTTWTAPANRVMVEAFGAGGGGGLGATDGKTCYAGGGGGGGGYVRGVVALTPGTTYTVNVGKGGAAATKTAPAQTGGSSGVSLNTTNLIQATGGLGGGNADLVHKTGGGPGLGGKGFSGAITRTGNPGMKGSSNPCGFPFPAMGGASYGGTVDYFATGGTGSAPPNASTPGIDGYVLVIW